MVPGILSIADIAANDYDPDFYNKEHPSFNPPVTVPWLVSLPFPALAGWIGNKIAGPVTAQTSDSSMRTRSAVGGLIMAVPTVLSFRVTMDESVILGARIAAGVTGTFFGMASLLMFYTAVRPGPFVKTRSQFAKYFGKRK